MNPFDKKYLSLQFWIRVHQKSGLEYQSFFESIMERAYPGFQKVRPYGNEGDRGNDGYRPADGIYYQVYAPLDPQEKEAEAAEKFATDFVKLKAWEKIATIKEVNFVYNDKGLGLTLKLESARAELRSNNPQIEFRVFTPRRLEEIFLSLVPEVIAGLGFDLDSRNALQSARDQLAKLDAELDRESGEFVLAMLNTVREIIARADDEDVLLEFELLEARAHLRIEEVSRARELFEGILKRHPDDPRAPLYLAEIALNNDDFDKNAKLLALAEHVRPSFWLLQLQKLVRAIRLEESVDPGAIDEKNFPTDPRIRSSFYRLAAAVIGYAGDEAKASAFLERSIHLNPERFTTHDARVAVRIAKLRRVTDAIERRRLADEILTEIAAIEEKFTIAGSLGARSQALLNLRKIYVYIAKEDYGQLEALARETVSLVFACHLDYLVERIIADVVHNVELGTVDFARLLQYVRQSDKRINDVLAKAILLQFLHKRNLFSDGRAFFREVGKDNFVSLIDAIRSNDHVAVGSFIGEDLRFAVDLALALEGPSDLRRHIVDALPDDGTVPKDKLLLPLYYDSGDLDKAFALVQRLDLSSLSHIECLTILRVARDKKAWDAVVILVEKILSHEHDPTLQLQMKLQLFTANFELKRFNEVIRLGQEMLGSSEVDLLGDDDKEMLVAYTASAYLKRRDERAVDFVRANERFLKTFETKIAIQAETFVKHGDAADALRSIIEGVNLLKHPSPEQYGGLFVLFGEIGNLLPELDLTSSETVAQGSFIKLADQERWYYLGDGPALDATKVPTSDDKYAALLGKRVGDSVPFAWKYRSSNPELVIEAILPIEKYILWQSRHHAQELTVQDRWDAMEMIPIPATDDSIDFTHLIARLQDDANRRGDFFNLYCEKTMPLALLAVNEGGLGNAIGRIANEKKGFINALAGTPAEYEEQDRVAQGMIAGDTFYLDGTSALFLAETGLLSKVHALLAGLRVPQSVIAMLFEIRERFQDSPGRAGHIAYVNGEVRFTEADPELYKKIRDRFTAAIDTLEVRQQNIHVISAANKSDSFLEQKVSPSLSDACILAQKHGVPVLTEDFLYLEANEVETQKPAPKYSSTLALVKALYRAKHLTLEEYLDYFAYLASYRVRFLPITTDDLELAVYGDQNIKVIKPEKIKQFNFALTLSQEYGVLPLAALKVVGSFLFRILIDDSLSSDMATRVFTELISAFPTKLSRRALGKKLLEGTVNGLNEQRRKSIVSGTRVQEKLDAIASFLRAYPPEELIVPN